MIIRLFRAWIPEDMREDTCGICGHEIAPASVIADLKTDDSYDCGVACAECVGYLGARSPEKAPTREQYEEALRRYPAPRGIEPPPERVREIAEQSGLDGDDFLAAMEDYRKPGHMSSLKRLADVLSLTEAEKSVVASAYTLGLGGAEKVRRAWKREAENAGA